MKSSTSAPGDPFGRCRYEVSLLAAQVAGASLSQKLVMPLITCQPRGPPAVSLTVTKCPPSNPTGQSHKVHTWLRFPLKNTSAVSLFSGTSRKIWLLFLRLPSTYFVSSSQRKENANIRGCAGSYFTCRSSHGFRLA